MKVDIKSFLIGVLTIVNLFLLTKFDDPEEEKVGRYQFGIKESRMYVMDTTTGQFVKIDNWATITLQVRDNKIEGGLEIE